MASGRFRRRNIWPYHAGPRHFLPWSAGPRVCPGQKMSQVEFVIAIATLFRQCRVKPVVRKGENSEQAKARLSELMEDSQPRLTLQMNNPEEVHLKWTRR